MKKLLSLVIGLAVAGCASPPIPKVPSPYGREPVNSNEAINEYRQQSSEENALRRDRTELQRRVEALQQQVMEMKAYIILQAAERPAEHPPTKQSHDKLSTVSDVERGEPSAIDIRADSVVFRVYHSYAATSFQPPSDIVEPMLKAAREGKQIVIRGRTDSNYANDANQRVALGRAVEAKRYLTEHGIDGAKIRLYFLSSGDFIASNNSAAGQAVNRRVEVEANGVNVAMYRDLIGS